MEFLKFNRFKPTQRQRHRHQPRHRRQIQEHNRSIASRAKRKGSPCQQDENSLDYQITGYSGPNLPQDIWCQIHSLMPIRDAARVACVSRAFLRSWRCHPYLVFSEAILGLDEDACGNDENARDFTSIVDRILKNHSGVGVKTVKLHTASVYDKHDRSHFDHLDSWLQSTVKRGIEELHLSLSRINAVYNFPCSVLSDETGDSLRYLHIASCNFHPTVGLGCLRSLARLTLCMVYINGDELGYLLSNSLGLERLELRHCSGIICLKIPCLQQLSYLEVLTCIELQVVESKAPNLSRFCFAGDLHVKLSLSGTLRIKKFERFCSGAAFYARTELPSNMPNLETLTIHSQTEMVNTPMVPSRFLHLKLLTIAVGGHTYDYFSLISFFVASPSLETFILNVGPERMERVSLFEDPSDLRKMPEHRHDKLKRVQIINFTSVKSLVELVCQILESTTSLECLTLDTTHGAPRCSVNKSGKCLSISKDALMGAHRALMAVETFIKSKVPSAVELNVLEPCNRCHAVKLSGVSLHHICDFLNY
ncbi:hypothetical protein ACP70R_043813 [Stipagrostis hirtigluma subsp. patula]